MIRYINMTKGAVFFLLLAVLMAPIAVFAVEAIDLNLKYPTFPGAPNINPNQPDTNQSLAAVVVWFYFLVVGISGLAAFVTIVWGGLQWMTSAGSPARIGDAKDKVQKALLGLLLVLASFLILRVINPELTNLRIPGLVPVECTKDAQGQCISFEEPAATGGGSQAVAFLTANGNEGSVLLSPQDQVALQWSFPGFQSCQAGSEPSGVWEGQKPPSGAEELGFLSENTYTFSLACFGRASETLRTVTVIVSSSEVVDETEPTVTLLADGFSGPLAFPSDELPDARVEFTWEATGADRCVGEDQFVIPGGQQQNLSGSMPLLFIGMLNGEYRYTVTCTNLTNGKSASDTVVVTVDI